MGGDNSPDATLKGAYLASQYLSKDESIVLVGNEKLAKRWAKWEQNYSENGQFRVY